MKKIKRMAVLSFCSLASLSAFGQSTTHECERLRNEPLFRSEGENIRKIEMAEIFQVGQSYNYTHCLKGEAFELKPGWSEADRPIPLRLCYPSDGSPRTLSFPDTVESTDVALKKTKTHLHHETAAADFTYETVPLRQLKNSLFVVCKSKREHEPAVCFTQTPRELLARTKKITIRDVLTRSYTTGNYRNFGAGWEVIESRPMNVNIGDSNPCDLDLDRTY